VSATGHIYTAVTRANSLQVNYTIRFLCKAPESDGDRGTIRASRKPPSSAEAARNNDAKWQDACKRRGLNVRVTVTKSFVLSNFPGCLAASGGLPHRLETESA